MHDPKYTYEFNRGGGGKGWLPTQVLHYQLSLRKEFPKVNIWPDTRVALMDPGVVFPTLFYKKKKKKKKENNYNLAITKLQYILNGRCVFYALPLKMGTIFQLVITPWAVYWPMAISIRNMGIAPTITLNTYGTRKAPGEKICEHN